MPRNVFHVQGGLGNQLFIYHAAAAQACTNEQSEVFLNISTLAKAKTPRLFELENFNFPIPYRITDSGLPRFANALARRVAQNSPFTLGTLGYYSKETGFDDVILTREFSNVTGYFQTWRYFNILSQKYPNYTLRGKPLTAWAQTKISEIRTKSPILCHFRRGDYWTLKSTIGVLDENYFRTAIAEFRSSGVVGPVWIMSDSIDQISSSFVRDLDATVLEEPKWVPAIDVFRVMQSFEKTVISNSTFSWWAAFTGDATSIVAPKPWFRDTEEPLSLIPGNWRRIESSWL